MICADISKNILAARRPLILNLVARLDHKHETLLAYSSEGLHNDRTAQDSPRLSSHS